MKMIGNGLRLIRVFFRLVFEMIRNYKKLNNDPDHNFLICKEICQKIVESAKIQLEIVQKEALPKLENFLLVSNHRCFFDVVFLLAAIEDTISFVAAKELWHYPILSRYLDSIGCVALERGAKKMETIKTILFPCIRHLPREILSYFRRENAVIMMSRCISSERAVLSGWMQSSQSFRFI